MAAITYARPFEHSSGRRRAAAAAAIFVVLAGVLHLVAAPQHLHHVGHSLFLVLAGVAQIAWGIVFWRRPSAALHGLGVVLAGALIVLWAVTRVLPAPFGHGPGELEAVGIASKVAEGAGLAGLVAMVLVGAHSRGIRWPTWRTVLAPLMLAGVSAAILYGAGLAAERVLPWLGGETKPSLEQYGLSPAAPALPLAPSASLGLEAGPALPSVQELVPLLTRSGNGPALTTLDVLYAPPVLLQLASEDLPQVARERPTAIFLLREADHDHEAGVGPGPITALLRVDKGETVGPYEVTVLSQDPFHRTSRLLFPLPPGTNLEGREKHTLTLVIPLGSEGENVFNWVLPLLEATGPSPAPRPTSAVLPDATNGVTRGVSKAAYGGVRDIDLQAAYLTREQAQQALPQPQRPDALSASSAFVVTETSHGAKLPPRPPPLTLRIDGRAYQPQELREVTASPHHRVTVFSFPPQATVGSGHHVVDLVLPDGQRLRWHLPLTEVAGADASTFRFTWVSVLAILGGVLAAMWPCLFQLTAYFIPSLAGVSMTEARAGRGWLPQWSVLRAALFFVAGFTVVYTAAGALIGFGGQALSSTTFFYTVQRPLTIAAGVVLIALALRVAARARVPLVCKMPLLSRIAHKRGAGPWEMMVAGVAFASGCMTCFGSAVLIGILVYTGLSGSAASGAFILFLFSLGMALPLVIGAIAMARVLPLLFHVEKVAPWMGLASALIMLAFAGLFLSGNYMAVSAWLSRLISF